MNNDQYVAENLDGREIARFGREKTIWAEVSSPGTVRVRCREYPDWHFEVQVGRDADPVKMVDDLLGGEIMDDLVDWAGKEIESAWKDKAIPVGKDAEGEWVCGEGDPSQYTDLQYFDQTCTCEGGIVTIEVVAFGWIFQFELWDYADGDDSLYDQIVDAVCEHLTVEGAS